MLNLLLAVAVVAVQDEKPAAGVKEVADTAALVAALRDGREGDTIRIAAGTYALEAPLEPKAGMTLEGAGMDRTILTHVASWKPPVQTLPDPEMRTKGMDTRAFLVRMQDHADGITVANMTLLGPQMHGAIFGFKNENVRLHHLRVKDTLWTGIRSFSWKGAKIHDCEFIDAGGRWARGGKPGVKGGITGGAIFAIWIKDSEIFNNRFVRTRMGKQDEFYGIKCRQGKRLKIHHNTIGANFSIELPFENDEDVEIYNNVLHGTVSIPKHAGGVTGESGVTFKIHHNWFTTSYAIEFVRNGVEIHHNLFDFDTEKDGGNLISGFGKAPAKGPAVFHNNLVSNPGRGVIWINEPYGNLLVRNNHVKARTTATPRKEGLFGFNRKCDFSTITIRSNVIECEGLPRPLLRVKESYGATVANNRLTNVADAEQLGDQGAGEGAGLEAPLRFKAGVNGEYTIDGWTVTGPGR